MRSLPLTSAFPAATRFGDSNTDRFTVHSHSGICCENMGRGEELGLTAELIAALCIAFGGGIVTGLAGFGFALAVVPPMLVIYDPPAVTAVAISLTLVTSWVVLLDSWRHIERRTVVSLLPGAIVGLGAGVAMVRTVDVAWIKLIAGMVVLSFTMALIRGWAIPGTSSPAAAPVAGFFSGALNAAIGMASPPVALLFATRSYGLQAFRSSIVAYFYVIDALAMTLLIQQRLVGWDELRVVASLLPAAIAGTFVGRALLQRTSQEQFRLVTLAILLGTGAVGLISALRDLA
ncbi:sulfite exporter TauE/SafE family protein [soil metagenome]